MDSSEFVLLLILAAFSGTWIFRAGRRLFRADALIDRSRQGTIYVGTLLGCIVVLWLLLATVAAKEVRQDVGLQALFVAGGLTAIVVATEVSSTFGLDAIDDGIERNNGSARIAVCGLWIAVTICAIGANIGDGDFVGTTFAPLALALAFMLAGIGIYAAATRNLAHIVVERDFAAGVRFASLAVALSIPLAKASSGDWVSISATWNDFVVAIPALTVVLIIALIFERYVGRNQPSGPLWPRGVVPAVFLVGIAAGATIALNR